MSALLTTPLHALHTELGAKLVPFAGHEMPVQYPLGVLKEHLHTRSQAGLFDVSHMGQIRVSGPGAAQALEALMPVDVLGLPPNQQRYALLTNAEGGILDDLMVGNWGDHYLLVVNAACKDADFAHLRRELPDTLQVRMLADQALLALQGPMARRVLARFAPDVAALRFMALAEVVIDGVTCQLSCSGYTGEDGFEIALPASAAPAIARLLLKEPEVAMVGLGARDSLRLEAGLCLYGHDIGVDTNPVCAGLYWAVSRARREGGERAGGYPGAAAIQAALTAGCAERRVMLRPAGRAPVREGSVIVDAEGETRGRVTSGGFGPSLEGPVAMGYVADAALKSEAPLFALVRGKPHSLEVLNKAPYSHRYVRG